MRVAVRVDSSSKIGSGHVMRGLTLAEELRKTGADVLFICRAHEGNLGPLIVARGFQLHLLPISAEDHFAEDRSIYSGWLGASTKQDCAQTAAAIKVHFGMVDWLIVDHYAIGETWESGLRPHAKRIMAIDDLANRKHDCDVLLDQNLVAGMSERYAKLVPETSETLLGPRYALLQPQYAELHAQSTPRKPPYRRILIYFGAADQNNLTGMAVEAFSGPEFSHLALDVVSSASNPHLDELRLLCNARGGATLHLDLPSLAPLMQQADLAVGGAGATSWERICMGLPALLISLAENQEPLAEEMEKRGIVRWLGNCRTATREIIRQAFADATETDNFSGLSQSFEMIDGNGTNRVVRALD